MAVFNELTNGRKIFNIWWTIFTTTTIIVCCTRYHYRTSECW